MITYPPVQVQSQTPRTLNSYLKENTSSVKVLLFLVLFFLLKIPPHFNLFYIWTMIYWPCFYFFLGVFDCLWFLPIKNIFYQHCTSIFSTFLSFCLLLVSFFLSSLTPCSKWINCSLDFLHSCNPDNCAGFFFVSRLLGFSSTVSYIPPLAPSTCLPCSVRAHLG